LDRSASARVDATAATKTIARAPAAAGAMGAGQVPRWSGSACVVGTSARWVFSELAVMACFGWGFYRARARGRAWWVPTCQLLVLLPVDGDSTRTSGARGKAQKTMSKIMFSSLIVGRFSSRYSGTVGPSPI
jgi:hypothetical protein